MITKESILYRWFQASTYAHLSVGTKLWTLVIMMGVYSIVAVIKENSAYKAWADFPDNMHSLVGLVLSLLLVFRTNTAYDRWWEGRKLWGQLNNDCRSLAIKARCFVKTDYEDLERFGHIIVQFARTLKDHLRETAAQKLAKKDAVTTGPKHVPIFVISLIYEQLGYWKKQGQIDGLDLLVLDKQASSFADILGACERIRNTPLTYSYRHFVNQAVLLYLITLPWGLVETFGLWTILATMLVSYLLLGLEIIAVAVEEPFGDDRDDLPLDDICNGIEASVGEILHEGRAA